MKLRPGKAGEAELVGLPETPEEWRDAVVCFGYEVDRWNKLLKDGQPVRCRFCGHWLRTTRLLYMDKNVACCSVNILCHYELAFFLDTMGEGAT